MAAHGAQKLFGWWGGPGLRGTIGMCSNLAYRWLVLMGVSLAVAELGGGLTLTAGLLSPLGALAVGFWWGVGVAGLAIVVAFLSLTVGRRRPEVAEIPA